MIKLNVRLDFKKKAYSFLIISVTVDIVTKKHFLFCNMYENICTKKSNFFYDILLRMAFQKPCYQSILARLYYLISFLACKIYEYRMFCRLESLDENTYNNISTHLKVSLNRLQRIYFYKKV